MDTPLKSLRWYLAVLVVASKVDDDASVKPLIDLQFRLIHACNAEAAFQRALELGKCEDHEYTNQNGQTVFWKFQGLHDLRETATNTIEDGAEVYSMMSRDSLEVLVRPKADLTVFWAAANKDRMARELIEST